jgi:hypothetical protein
MKRLSSKLHWLLPPNHSHQPYWLVPRYRELTTVHTLPYINFIVQQPTSFWFLDLKMGPTYCPESSVRNYHYTLHSSQGECGSHLLHGGRLKSHPNFVATQQILPQCCYVINYINTYDVTNKFPVSFPLPLCSCYLPK